MVTTTAYHAESTPDNATADWQEWIDVLTMMVVPCLPLGRATTMLGCPFIVMFLLIACFYVGGLWVFTSFYAQDGYVLLTFLSGWTVIFAGWYLYAVGPVVAIAILAFWYMAAIGCSLNDFGGPPCSRATEEPFLAAAAVGCFLALFGFTFGACHALLRDYATKDQRNCSAYCLACFAPCLAIARAARIAREARAREEHHNHDIPAYTA